jgi:hypothetical protein
MDLRDFGSLFELFAALNIAFVAVEYIGGYVDILLNKVFRLKDQIEIRRRRLQDMLIDKESLCVMGDFSINGKTVNIEGHIRLCEVIEKRISVDEEKLKSAMRRECNFSSVANTFLYSFFYCIVILFCSGLSANIANSFLFYFTCLTALLLISLWFAEKVLHRWFFRLTSVIILFICSVVISILLSFLAKAPNWTWLPIVYAIIPSIVFIVYFFKTVLKHKRLLKQVNHGSDESLFRDCEAWKGVAKTMVDLIKLPTKDDGIHITTLETRNTDTCC